MLRSDAEHEIEHLINSFTVNETYFYREDHQLRCMTSNLVDGIMSRKQPGDSLRIWSIPCSTGEEPYSIAMWLMENWREVDTHTIEIVGSDIDTRALRAAAEGIYGARALMRLSSDLIERYFQRIDGGLVQIIPGFEAGAIHARQSHRPGGHGAISQFRYRILPECVDLFRRCGAPTCGGKPV